MMSVLALGVVDSPWRFINYAVMVAVALLRCSYAFTELDDSRSSCLCSTRFSASACSFLRASARCSRSATTAGGRGLPCSVPFSSTYAHARIEPGVEDVDERVHEHDEEGAVDDGGQDHRQVE